MPDHAISAHPRVQAQLDRLTALSPGADILGLERITRLLDRIGNPHLRLPPVFHVAGTNGKGSTCAFLRAALEADGRRVHVYSSPHLVRFNERIRLAGRLVEDDMLADALGDVLDHAGGIGASFFEVTTAVAFRLFADVPADACIVEVGLGGRLDATNVLPAPAACGIAQLGLDHQQFLGNTLPEIAGEKAAIAKPGAPVATQRYAKPIARLVEGIIADRGGRAIGQSEGWDIAAYRDGLHYRDSQGRLDLDLPSLPGVHQHGNLGLAIAMLRHQNAVPVSEAAIRAAPRWAHWPGRLQRLERGPLLAALPPEVPAWLDGGHNPAAGNAIAAWMKAGGFRPRSVALLIGMLANKDAGGFLKPLWPWIGSLHSVTVDGHESHDAATFERLAVERAVAVAHHAGIAEAVAAIAAADAPDALLVTGSLYLAGEVLAANGQPPD